MEKKTIAPKVLFLLRDKATFKPSTQHTYGHLLTSLYAATGKNTFDDSLFNDVDLMIECVQKTYKKSDHSKATAYSALYGLTKNPVYYGKMNEHSDAVKDKYKKQALSPDRPVGSQEEIRNVHERWLYLYKQDPKNAKYLANALLTGLASGYYPELPPRRLEWASMLIAHDLDDQEAFDQVEENYTDGETITLHKHKTRRFEDSKTVLPFPKDLKPLFQARKDTGSEYLLVNNKSAPFNATALSERLRSLFGFSVDILRQSYITAFNGGMQPLADMEELSRKMGNSVYTQVNVYTKK